MTAKARQSKGKNLISRGAPDLRDFAIPDSFLNPTGFKGHKIFTFPLDLYVVNW